MSILNKQIAPLAIGILTIGIVLLVASCSFDRLSIEKGRLNPNGIPPGMFTNSATNQGLSESWGLE
jgi:hypothetical protein